MMTDRNNGEPTGRDGAGRFTSGNPGRPRGARHKATVASVQAYAMAELRRVHGEALGL
jgi:hypothetical protein